MTAQPELFLGIVGLPRSGTTLLTALLDAHPRIGLYYEPWNAFKKTPPAVPEHVAAFCAAMEARFGFPLPPQTRIAGFKETTILPGATEWATRTLASVSRSCDTRVLWIFRDPLHCLLSKLEAAHRWWGHPDAPVSEERLAAFLRDSGPSLAALSELVARHGGAIVQYDALVSEPAGVLREILTGLGEEYRPEQLAYHEAGPQPHKVMGDVEVARQPAPVSDARRRRREAERRDHAPLLDAVFGRDEFAWIRRESQRLAALPPVLAQSRP